MVDIPLKPTMTPQQAYELLQGWYLQVNQLKQLKKSEMPTRKMLAEFYFPNATVGKNRLDLGGGYTLVLSEPDVTRKVDAELLAASDKILRKAKVDVDALVAWKPSLVKKEYDKLTDEQKLLVDGILDIDDKGAPSLEIVAVDPAKQARHAEHVAAATSATDDEPAPTAAPAKRIVQDPEKATHGDYCISGDAWWMLNEANDWDAVEDPALIDELNALQAAPAKPKRRPGRPRKAAEPATTQPATARRGR